MMMHGGGGWMIGGLAVLFFFLVLVLVVIGLGIWLAARSAKSHAAQAEPGSEARAEDPLEIVRRRYAKGEITREEYQSLREDLAK